MQFSIAKLREMEKCVGSIEVQLSLIRRAAIAYQKEKRHQDNALIAQVANATKTVAWQCANTAITYAETLIGDLNTMIEEIREDDNATP